MQKAVFSVSALCLGILLLSWPLISTISFQHHRHAMHLKIKHQVESVLSEDFTVSVAEFPQLNKMKEFDFNGNRYDLVSAVKKGNFWMVKAVNDTKEKAMEKNLKRQNSADGKETAAQFWLSIHAIQVNTLSKIYLSSIIRPFPQRIYHLQCGHNAENSPPPELV